MHTNPSGQQPLQVTLRHTEKNRIGQPITIAASITNNSEDAISLLIWNTPFETPVPDIFSIREYSTRSLSFQGLHINRGIPQERDFHCY